MHMVLYVCFYAILNMKRNYIPAKSKALSSCFSGKSIVSNIGGTRFKPCLLPFVCSQIFLGHYFHYMCICLILYLRLSFSSYFQHANVYVWPSPLLHCTFSILSIPYNFPNIAENLHDNVNLFLEDKSVSHSRQCLFCSWNH